MRKFTPKYLKNYWPVFGYLLISILFLSPVLIQSGVPFKYDWNWPLFSMKESLASIYDFGNSGLLAVFSRYLNLLLGSLGYLGISPSIAIKCFLLTVHTLAGYGFYRYLTKRGVNNYLAFITGIAYSFSAYIFIRTIVGFTTSLVAYAAMPFLVDRITSEKFKVKDLIISIIAFVFILSQSQAGVLAFLFIFIWLLLPNQKIKYLEKIKRVVYLIAGVLLVNLPWFIVYALKRGMSIPSGSETTTLNFIGSLPHSLLRVLMLSDHHITYQYFQFYSHLWPVMAGFLIIYVISFWSFKDKSNRNVTQALFISSLLILPFTLGPTGIFSSIYSYFYTKFPIIALFRETYHFEFLLSFALISMFGFGLNQIDREIKNIKLKKYFNIAALLLVALFIAQYLKFDYFGRFSLHRIPNEYHQLNSELKKTNICSKIYYPPSLGFMKFTNDNTADAANSDLIAKAIGVPYITDGASVLNLSNKDMFIRNRLTSQFLDKNDSGEFVKIFAASGTDCLIVRRDMISNFQYDAKINFESDQNIIEKWGNQPDMLNLANKKHGFSLVKQFGENIYVFKINNQLSAEDEYKNQNIQSIERYSNPTILPLTSWATEYNYYKDGWIRGRYAFWRKEIFADLMQDFLYTTRDGAILTHQMDENLSGKLMIRYLDGGSSGQFVINIGGKEFTVNKNSGTERFIVKEFGEVEIKRGDTIEVKNISGENAIADLIVL